MNVLLSLFAANVFASSPIYRKMTKAHSIYTQPAHSAQVRGYTASGSYIQIVEELSGTSSGDCMFGWARLQQGFICLDQTEEYLGEVNEPGSSWTLSWAPPEPSDSDDTYWVEDWFPEDIKPTLLVGASGILS